MTQGRTSLPSRINSVNDSIIWREPFRKEIDSLFKSFVDDFFTPKTKTFFENSLRESFPKIDIIHEDGKYLFNFYVAGYKKEDILVDLTEDNCLVVSTNLHHTKNDVSNFEKTIYSEIKKSSFTRKISLNSNILNLEKKEDIKCTCKDGVLTVEIPELEKSSVKEKNTKLKIE